MKQLSNIEKESAKNATLIVTVSKYSFRKIVQLYDADEAKIRVVPNGVDPQRFRPINGLESFKHRLLADKDHCVLFVGNLVPRKGLHFLIEAAKYLIEEKKKILFIIVGEGPLKRYLLSYTKKSGVSENFLFLGHIPDTLLTLIYNLSDVFVLPSLQEGQGITLLEAQASAKPIVAFDVGGVNEFVLNKKSGLLTKTDSYELAEAILTLLSDKAMRIKMGQCGREFVSKNFSWDICSQKMYQVYCEALRKR
jgi:glycogen(starch) synthase